MQPSLFALQPSIEEIISSDYPFGVDEAAQLVDPVEFANSLPLASEASQSQPQSRGKQMPAMGIPQQQSYSSKEYDAANMLVDYRFTFIKILNGSFGSVTNQCNSNASIHPRQLPDGSPQL